MSSFQAASPLLSSECLWASGPGDVMNDWKFGFVREREGQNWWILGDGPGRSFGYKLQPGCGPIEAVLAGLPWSPLLWGEALNPCAASAFRALSGAAVAFLGHPVPVIPRNATVEEEYWLNQLSKPNIETNGFCLTTVANEEEYVPKYLTELAELGPRLYPNQSSSYGTISPELARFLRCLWDPNFLLTKGGKLRRNAGREEEEQPPFSEDFRQKFKVYPFNVFGPDREVYEPGVSFFRGWPEAPDEGLFFPFPVAKSPSAEALKRFCKIAKLILEKGGVEESYEFEELRILAVALNLDLAEQELPLWKALLSMSRAWERGIAERLINGNLIDD